MKNKTITSAQKLACYSGLASVFIMSDVNAQSSEIFYHDFDPDIISVGSGVTAFDVNDDDAVDFSVQINQATWTESFSGSVYQYKNILVGLSGAADINIPLASFGGSISKLYEGQPIYAGSFIETSLADGVMYYFYNKSSAFLNGEMFSNSQIGLWNEDNEIAFFGVRFHTVSQGYGWVRMGIDLPDGTPAGGSLPPVVTLYDAAYVLGTSTDGLQAGDPGDTAQVIAVQNVFPELDISVFSHGGTIYVQDHKNIFLQGDVSVINSIGQTVYTAKVEEQNNAYACDALVAGIYTVLIEKAGEQKVKQIYIQ